MKTPITHTPGPWRASKVTINAQAGGYVVLWPDTSRPGVHHRRLDYKGEFLAADATLMAAAPDMLAALQGVLRVADRATVEFDAVRAAIAKATEVQQ